MFDIFISRLYYGQRLTLLWYTSDTDNGYLNSRDNTQIDHAAPFLEENSPQACDFFFFLKFASEFGAKIFFNMKSKLFIVFILLSGRVEGTVLNSLRRCKSYLSKFFF